MILFVIDMMNSVHNLPMNLPTDFTDEIYSVGKNGTSSFFFCFVLIFFSMVIPSVFPFVFIDFLVVFVIIGT